MSSEYTFSRFVYFDTGIVSHVANRLIMDDAQLWQSLFDLLTQNDLTLGVSDALLAELHDADRLHDSIVRLFASVPSALLKNGEMILDEEVEAYPESRTESLWLRLFNINRQEEIRGLLSNELLSEARGVQLQHAEQMRPHLVQVRGNFLPSSTGQYTRNQANEFATAIVNQWLNTTHPDFLLGVRGLSPNSFLSLRLYAYVVFYIYYLGRREPENLSDFGDLFHLASIPYCELAVMERDLCEVLNQIKRNADIPNNPLASTTVRNIEFFGDWVWR